MYAAFDGLLNPKRPPSTWGGLFLQALLTIARYGMPTLKQAVEPRQLSDCGQIGIPHLVILPQEDLGNHERCWGQVVRAPHPSWLAIHHHSDPAPNPQD